MFGFLGILFPRHSRNYITFRKYINQGNEQAARFFLLSLEQEEKQKLIQEITSFDLDEYEQEIIRSIRKEVEDKSYPITFSDN